MRSSAGWLRAGVRLEDIELVIATHHHHDHVGARRDDQAALAARASRCSTAPPTTAPGISTRSPRIGAFSRELMRDHGVPETAVRPTRRAVGVHRATAEPSTPTSASGTAIASGPAGASCASWPGPATARPTRCSSTPGERGRVRRRPPAREDLARTPRSTAAGRTARPVALAHRVPGRASSARRRCRSCGSCTGHGGRRSDHAAPVIRARARAAPAALRADHANPRSAAARPRLRSAGDLWRRHGRPRAAAAGRLGGARAPRPAARRRRRRGRVSRRRPAAGATRSLRHERTTTDGAARPVHAADRH